MIAAAALAPSRQVGGAIEVDALGYRYKGASMPAIDRIDLHVAAGELVCILGPSGCGKTTLLRLIAGLLRPTTGHLATAIGSDRPRIGWMAQRDGLLPWRTVQANVELPLRLHSHGRTPSTAAARDLLERVGLSSAARLYPHQLSGGMRQRAALARALVHEPAFLLLDEPFAHLDELTRDELGDELVRLCAPEQPTVVMVTHSPLEAARLADRVVVLSPGPARILGEIGMSPSKPRQETDSAVLAAVTQAKELLRCQQ